ncbi:MAG: PTS transporter subunit EIIC [bacterium]|nr:PTS transporter subunit EIIC [bacterium]
MASKYEDVCKEIVDLVGGKGNINSLTHCVTRLRFTLKDESKADTAKLETTRGVLKVVQAGGQYQVVIGAKVNSYYETICEMYNIGTGTSVAAEEETSKGTFNTLMNTISGILAPTLGVLTAAGITKGVISLLATLGIVGTDSGVYMLLYALGDGFFYFLPILLGFTAARKFKCSEFIGAAVGCALVYPAMVNIGSTMEIAGTIFAGTAFEMSYYNTFFGIPIIMPGAGYTSSVIPIILAVYAASKIEKWCKNHIHELLRAVLTPLITLIVTVVLTYIVIGPVSMVICGVISLVINALYEVPVVGGIIAGAILGGGFGVLVLFGLHWVIISLALSTIAIQGYDIMMACGGIGPMIGMFQGIAICIAARKNQKVMDLAVPSTISQICGVGEPLMYSILIPIKKLFALNIIGGCLGGAILGILGTKMYMFGGSGLFGIFNYVNPNGGMSDVVKYCVGVGIAGICTMIATIAMWNDEEASRCIR